MLAAPVLSLRSLLIRRPLVGVAGVVVLALTFLVSVLVRQPRVFTFAVPVAGGLILAQGVGSTAWLGRLHPGRPLSPGWIILGQVAGAVICWLVLAWVFWLRT
jgi:hypothetical protein